MTTFISAKNPENFIGVLKLHRGYARFLGRIFPGNSGPGKFYGKPEI